MIFPALVERATEEMTHVNQNNPNLSTKEIEEFVKERCNDIAALYVQEEAFDY